MQNIFLRIVVVIFTGFMLLMSSSSYARTEKDQKYVTYLLNGGPMSIRYVAREIFQSTQASPEVLDVLAELLLQNYDNGNPQYIDALSWVCRVLGRQGQGRYRNVLSEVAEKSSNQKLKKFAQISLSGSETGDVSQYIKGSLSLANMRKAEAAISNAQNN